MRLSFFVSFTFLFVSPSTVIGECLVFVDAFGEGEEISARFTFGIVESMDKTEENRKRVL